MKIRFALYLLSPIMAGASSQAHAELNSLDLSPYFNTGLVTVAADSLNSAVVAAANAVPSSATFDVNGVPFTLQAGTDGGPGIIALNAYGSESTVTLNVSLEDVQTFYTIANSLGGMAGADLAQIKFIGSKPGDEYTYDYVAATNIRDWYQPGVGTHLDAVYGTKVYGDANLDVQAIALPTSFASDTITQIVITSSTSWNNFGQGAPFFAAMSYGTAIPSAPEAATWAMMLAGFGAIGAAMRRKATAINFG